MIKYFLIFIISLSLIPPLTPAQTCDNGAFGAPVLKFTKIAGNTGIIVGGRAGWIINKRFVIGAGYYTLANEVSSDYMVPPDNKRLLLDLNYGGLEFEYLILYESTYNLSLSMLFGSGGLNFYLKDENKKFSNRNLLVWEPNISFEVKINEWLHADAGMSYRMISSYTDVYNISRNDLQGITGILTLKLGGY
jgi:hypothetical protein